MESLNGIRRSSSTDIMRTPDGSEAVIPANNRVKLVDLKFGAGAHGKAMYSLRILRGRLQDPAGCHPRLIRPVLSSYISGECPQDDTM